MASTSTEKIFTEFREHSVAEFFKKNQQMLGFSGKTRSLTTIVHEYVTNSVTWDTPTVIRAGGKTRIARIGEIIDESMRKGGTETAFGIESLREFEKFEVLCFDKKSMKMKFKPVQSLHRHRLEAGEKLYRIRLVGGRMVESTRHHGLFTLRGGKAETVMAEDLSVGDYAVVPRNPWLGEANAELNLIEEALKLPDAELGEFSIYGAKEILYKDKGLKDAIRAQLPPRGRHCGFYRYMKCDRLPIRLLRALSWEKRTTFCKCLVGARHGKKSAKLPAIFPVSAGLMQFLGLYAAEGNTRETMASLSLSFGSHEKELIEYSATLAQGLFGIKPEISPAHKTAVNVVLHDKTVCFLMSKILGCGKRAVEKRVPGIVFDSSKEMAREFFFAYLAGDGYPSGALFQALREGSFHVKGKITLATASSALALELQYLLSALGISYSFQNVEGEKRMINGELADFKQSCLIELYLDQTQSPLNFYPIAIGGITAVTEAKLKWAINNRGQGVVAIEKVPSLAVTGAQVTEEAVAFCKGDLGVLQVSEIQVSEPPPDTCVYDYSVEGDENFIGGFGAICLHNSLDACEEAGTLPEVEITVKEIDRERYVVIAEDNGPGIPEKHVGKALGQMLAGTKFHRYCQQRGQQGIGASGCTMYAQVTTGKPVKAVSRYDRKKISCEVSIDLKSNSPKVMNLVKEEGDFGHGLEVEGEFADVKYDKSSFGVYEYIRRTALANPHLQITLHDPEGQTHAFPRSSDKVPAKPVVVQPHPLGISTNDLIDFAHREKECRRISSFLQERFARFSAAKVDEIRQLCPDVDFEKKPTDLQWVEAEKIIKAIQSPEMRWIAPATDSVKPIGSEQIEKSLRNILAPQFVVVAERSPKIYKGGIPFMVEAALAYGGGAGKKSGDLMSSEVIRYANRAPLLFDNSGCAITEAVRSIDWKRYKLKNFDEEPLSVFVNISSVYVPYTSAGKQAISNDEEIVQEIKNAVMEAARNLQSYLSGIRREHERKERKKAILRYLSQLSVDLADLAGKGKASDIEKRLAHLIEHKYSSQIEEDESGEEEIGGNGNGDGKDEEGEE
jgi:DNA topoisomerase-6 subunit B